LLIHYRTQGPLAELWSMLLLLRFGTSTLYRTGAMMDAAEPALGVNVVE